MQTTIVFCETLFQFGKGPEARRVIADILTLFTPTSCERARRGHGYGRSNKV
jgi:hypothetical protein